jgi:ABC-type Fe3+/spermidine/putrescine transport system ATPase subunit
MSINFEQITKRYNATPVVNDASLKIEAGEFFVLLGPSGSGKSTLLRIAAGLTEVDHGRISFHGRDVTHVHARDRGVGLVFQNYALFRHMTVGQNVEFALRVRGVKRKQRARRRDELLRLVALDGFADRLPGQLSGGQQQRVAVARALAHEPQVLLLDEPFGALDAKIRVELRDTIRQVQRRLGMTTILVTHDQEEAFALADRIGIMHGGRLLETGRAEALYRRPTTRFVASFLGAANFLLGERGRDGLRLGSKFLATGDTMATAGAEKEVVAIVRPEDIEVGADASQLHSQALAEGYVESVEFAGIIERLRIHIAPHSGVRSALASQNAQSKPQLILDVARTHAEQGQLPLAPGKRVTLGVRRFHALPTPIASFRILAREPALAAELRASPLLQQLARSMQAPVISDGQVIDEDSSQTGVAVIGLRAGAVEQIKTAVSQGRREFLCLPTGSHLPGRILIYCASDAARAAALGLVASIMRHLHAEATFVSIQDPTAPRAEITNAFRSLLDARAELQRVHGLDIRTDVQIGGLGGWIQQLASMPDPTLVVLGLDGSPRQLEQKLAGSLAPLFSPSSNCPVIVACSAQQETIPENFRAVAIQDTRQEA